ncbi:MAG: peptidase S41, partial [Gammaproteobacteria bacterium]|nr:peptidase S41 [Gammaproteobacteria bacterium]
MSHSRNLSSHKALSGSLRKSALLLAVCSSLISGGQIVTAQEDSASARPLPLAEVRLFAEALETIRSAYVQDIDDQTLINHAIRGMLAGLDPHSAYLSADDYDVLQENTESGFGGLGIEVGEEDGYIKVITPIDD